MSYGSKELYFQSYFEMFASDSKIGFFHLMQASKIPLKLYRLLTMQN